MLYQNDSYAFTLTLTREEVTVLDILSVTYSPSISPYAMYTFDLVSGPYPTLNNKVVVTGMAHSPNNGTFTIVDLDQEIDSLGIGVGGIFFATNVSAVTAVETGTGTIGTAPNVTTPPVIQIVQLAPGFASMLGSPASMTNVTGDGQLWSYTWSIGAAPSGDYMAIVSYAADGNIFNGRPLEKIRVGDQFILGTLALNATVAKDATVAKNATVAHASDLAAINPNTSSIILDIQSKVDNLPSDPAGMTLLAPAIQNILDIHDAALGNQSVDKTQNPALYTMTRLDTTILAQYHLFDTPTVTSRVKQ